MKRFVILIMVLFIGVQAYGKNIPAAQFEDIGLQDFIKFVAVRENLNIIYSQNEIPRNLKITLYSPSALTNQDLLKIFYSVLKENNIVATQQGNTILLSRYNTARAIGGKYVSKPSSLSQNTLSTVIIRLKNVNVMSVSSTVRHVMSPYGILDIIRPINTLVITDTKYRIDQISKLLRTLDSDDKIIVKLIPIKNASSGIIANELNRFFNDLRVRNGMSYSPIIINESESNSLLVAARMNDFNFINSVINSILSNTEKNRFQRVFYLKNAVAKDVYDVITKLLSKSPSFKGSSISYDEATNSILFVGSPVLYNKVKQLIDELDVPRKEVYIEALIIETSLSKLSEFGVEWSATAKSGHSIGYAGNTNTGNLGNLEGSIINNNKFTPLPNGFNLGILGNTVTYNGVKFATLGALLNALKSNSDINIVSNPKIVTLDNQKATIFVGENRPYLTSQKYDSNGNPIYTYDYKDVGVKLTILPHINGDKILLNTNLEIKKVAENVMVGNTMAPVTLTRETSTKISLVNGEKILISGLIENDTQKQKTGVPILSDIPILGGLFEYKKNSTSKTNLMVFLSVRIVNNNETVASINKNAKVLDNVTEVK